MSVGRNMIPVRTIPISSVSTNVRYSPQRVSGCGAAFQPCRTCREHRYGTAKVEGRLTSPMPGFEIITQRCGGITVKGHTLKSFAYTTDAVDYPQHERERHPSPVCRSPANGDHAGAAHRGIKCHVRRRVEAPPPVRV